MIERHKSCSLPPSSVLTPILFQGTTSAAAQEFVKSKAEMTFRRSALRAIALLSVLALGATACGGGSEDPVTQVADIPTVEPIATTPPLQVDDVAPIPTSTDDFGFNSVVEGEEAEPDNPWEVVVLEVNDDVQIVPAFDGPNGENIAIYDVNEIDGTQAEYPLYADTYFGNRLTLLVEQYDPSGHWAEVALPVRPNGTTAWVQTAFFTEVKHDYHITIDVTKNLVNVFKGDELIVEQLAVTGRESRPTPVVRAYIDEKIPGADLSPAYGSWILSIAAFSEDLGTFGGGGMPKLALHGTNQPDLMGQYVSSGCIRVPDEIIELIADTVPVGTIVDIIAT